METKIIAKVNNVDIVATSDEQLVPIRPICEALGIDANGQNNASNGMRFLVQLRV